MSPYRVFEIAFYELIDFLPNLLLAFIPFQNHLRIAKWKLAIIAAFLYLLLTASRLLSLSHSTIAPVLTLLWLLLYLLVYRISIRARLTKLLFVLLILLNYGSFTAVIVCYLANCNPQNLAGTTYSFRSSLNYLGILAVTCPPVFLFMRNRLKPLMDFTENDRIWRILWMVPATFCLSYYYNLYANGGIQAFSSSFNNVLFAAAYNAGAFFVNYPTVRLVEENNTSNQLKAENYQLNLQFVQYENLKNRMDEARRARHDLRHSMTIIQSYLKDDNKEGLQAYLEEYTATLSDDSPIFYCDNYALNAIIVYYREIAEKNHIQFQAMTRNLDQLPIPDSDLVVLFGNLLENATEACMRQRDGSPRISLRVQTIESALVITLDNTYDGAIQKTEDGYLSAKGERIGIGIVSIKKIVEKYHGVVKFEHENRVFKVSISLYP